MAKVLIIIPHFEFRDEEYQKTLDALKEGGHETHVASSSLSPAHGVHGAIVQPDLTVTHIPIRDYEAIIFIGGPGATEYFSDPSIIQIVRDAFYERVLLGAIGRAPTYLAHAGVIGGKKITAFQNEKDVIEMYGGFFTGRLVEQDGEIITGCGPEASEEFGKAITKALGWRSSRKSFIS